MSVVSIVAVLAMQAVADQPPALVPAEATSPAMASATANKSQARTAPTLVRQPEWRRSDAAKDAGEFGEVVLTGLIGEDGRFSEAKVVVSSRSKDLDAAALAAASEVVFEPARDVSGKALSIPAKFAIEYPQAKFHGTDGLSQYRCAQFVRDYDWWYRTWPAEKNDRVFATLRGFVTVAELRGGNTKIDFKAEWSQAIDDCRRAPNKLMLDMLKPHGRMLREMVK
jgi:TonB family protein